MDLGGLPVLALDQKRLVRIDIYSCRVMSCSNDATKRSKYYGCKSQHVKTKIGYVQSEYDVYVCIPWID